MRLSILLLASMLSLFNQTFSQTCTGTSGPVIFMESFGAGPNPGPELPAGTTTYGFGLGGGGLYSVVNDSGQNGTLWHSAPDHTPDDTDGYMLLFDAAASAGIFYQTTLEGLCANTTYVFSCFVANIVVPSACGGSSTEPDLRFTLIDPATGLQLGTTTTGSIPVSSSLEWNEYGITFLTGATQTEVQVQITNNAPGGCGNDLVIDDFTFRPCNPYTEQAFEICDLPGASITVGNNTYTTAGTYEDLIPIAGSCNDSTVVTTLTGESQALPTIQITFCSGDSAIVNGDVYTSSVSFIDTLATGMPCPPLQPYVIISQEPQTIINDVFLCLGESIQVGGNSYTAAGTYVDSLQTAAGCDSTIITNITSAGIEVQLNVNELTLELGEMVTLSATTSFSDDFTLSWLPPTAFSCNGCPMPSFQPFSSGVYTLVGTDVPSSCTDSIQFSVEVLPCNKVFIPNAFSPNQDGVNDTFQIFAKPCYTKINKMMIFDRWGGLVYEEVDQPIQQGGQLWDGQIGGKPAATGIYVYALELEVIDGSTQQWSGDVLLVR